MPSEEGQLECPQCKKEFPLGSIEKCPDDGTELSINFSAPDPLIGKTFAEKYDILDLLGEGGMCKVYRAKHKYMKRIVAVKLLHEEATRDPQAKARFQKEAEAASALSHQNVVTVHDFGFTPSGQAFFVMDCLDGKALDEMIDGMKGELMPLSKAIDIFAQACDGLDHAHRKGIVHRDIKPSNLVISIQEDGSDLVKIVDFGIAKVLSPPEGEKQQQLTMAGEIFGTPAYMSPEQCNGQPLDGRSDLYSFACLMYETLSGTPPHMGDTFINTIVKHINDPPKSFAEVSPDLKVPSHIEAVIIKCLAKDPSQRYSSAVELKQALFDAAFASGVKGMRFGGVPEPRIILTSSGAQQMAQRATLSERKVTRNWRVGLIATLSVVAVTVLLGGAFALYYPGPKGDSGTPYDKFVYSNYLADADDYSRDGKFAEAAKSLEKAKDIAMRFGDGKGRLEATLNKLGEVYGNAREYAKQEAVNKELTSIATEKVYKEYDELMKQAEAVETPEQGHAANQERALQAAAFAERIAICATKLSIRSREKEEKLLERAIKVYDSMDSKDWLSQVRLRGILGECYRLQQRVREQETVLKKAIELCPDKPNSSEGWRAKIHAMLLLGQLYRNLAVTPTQYDESRRILDEALRLVRENLSDDKELLRDALNSVAIVNRLYHTDAYDTKAVALEKEAEAVEKKLDSHAEDAPEVKPE